jgi:hypothetical protein
MAASWALRSKAAAEVERPVPAAADTRRRGANDRPQSQAGTRLTKAKVNDWPSSPLPPRLDNPFTPPGDAARWPCSCLQLQARSCSLNSCPRRGPGLLASTRSSCAVAGQVRQGGPRSSTSRHRHRIGRQSCLALRSGAENTVQTSSLKWRACLKVADLCRHYAHRASW